MDARIIEFCQASARRQGDQVVDLPEGFGVLSERFAASYDHNRIVLPGVTDPAVAMGWADEVLVNRTHRQIHVDAEVASEPFVEAGYEHAANVLMRHEGELPDGGGVLVEEVSIADLQAPSWKAWRAELPDISDDAVNQLVDRRITRMKVADEVVFLGVWESGELAAHCDLYLGKEIAQIEDLLTFPGFRGRGYAKALIAEGLRRAQSRDVAFLIADADDWPIRLYERLGFVECGRTNTFTRPS